MQFKAIKRVMYFITWCETFSSVNLIAYLHQVIYYRDESCVILLREVERNNFEENALENEQFYSRAFKSITSPRLQVVVEKKLKHTAKGLDNLSIF